MRSSQYARDQIGSEPFSGFTVGFTVDQGYQAFFSLYRPLSYAYTIQSKREPKYGISELAWIRAVVNTDVATMMKS